MKQTRTNPFRVLVLMACLVSGASRAEAPSPQQETSPQQPPVATEVPVRGTGQAPSLRLLDEKDTQPRPGTVNRILAELGMGILMGAGLGIGGGYMAGNAICVIQGGVPTGFNCLLQNLITGFAGAHLGMGLGVWLGGNLLGGSGNLGVVMLTSALTAAVTILSAVALNNFFSVIIAVVGTLGLAPVAAIWAYEATHNAATAALSQASQPHGQNLLPMVGFTPQGPMLTLAGRF